MAFYQFPGSNFHDLNLDWLLQQMKNCLAEWATTKTQWENLLSDNTAFKEAIESEWQEVKDYINNYFDNLDVTEEIRQIINELANNGTLLQLIKATVEAESAEAAAAWLDQHISSISGYVIDDSLTVENAAADAKATGEAIADTRISIVDERANVVFAFPLTVFRGKAKFTTAIADDETHALMPGIKFNYPVMVACKSDYSMKVWLDGTLTDKRFVPTNTLLRVEIWRNDEAVFTGDDANSGALYLICSPEAKAWLESQYYITPKAAQGSPKSAITSGTYPFATAYFDDTIKLIRRGKTYTIVTTRLVKVTDDDFVMGMSGYSASNNPYATWYRTDAEQEPIIVNHREMHKIPAGEYVVAYVSDSNHTATYNPAEKGIFANFARPQTVIERLTYGNQISTAISGTMTGGCHCAALDPLGRMWFVSLDGTYCVIRDADYTTKVVPLPAAGEHDNNMSIVGNHLYISDWYNPVVYDYLIDYETDTITGYERIELPTTDEYRIQADFISETEAVTAGWDPSPRSYIRISRIAKGAYRWFIQDTFCIKPSDATMQGMRVYGNKLFILFDTSADRSSYITVVDLDKHRVISINATRNFPNNTSPYESESIEVSQLGFSTAATDYDNSYAVLVTSQQGQSYVFRIEE